MPARRIRTFTIMPHLPERLQPLLKLAYNMWWSWNHEAVFLFRRIDEELFVQVEDSPVKLLGTIDQARVEQLVQDEGFLAHMERVVATLDRYMTGSTWYQDAYGDANLRIAYFSMEFGIHESIPIYSGGLALADDTRNDQVFGIFITTHLPAGLVGLVVAAVLAAAMSSSLNSSANAFVTDFYRPLRPGRAETHYLTISKLMTSFWGVAQIAVALAAEYLRSQQSIVGQVLAVAGFTTGLLLGLFILGSLRRPVRSGAALIGLMAGLAAATAAWLPSTWKSSNALAWPWYAPIGTLTTVGVGWLAGVIASRRKESA